MAFRLTGGPKYDDAERPALPAGGFFDGGASTATRTAPAVGRMALPGVRARVAGVGAQAMRTHAAHFEVPEQVG